MPLTRLCTKSFLLSLWHKRSKRWRVYSQYMDCTSTGSAYETSCW